MSSLKVNIEQYRNTAYQIGYLQGLNLDRSLLEKMGVLESPFFDEKSMEEALRRFAPHLLEELRGLADGLNVSFQKAASLFSGYGEPEIQGMGCSSVVHPDFAVRNYDFTPDLYDQRFVLIQSDEYLASAGHGLHVIGRHEGVNEAGLFISFHFVNNNKTKPGFTASSIVRIILDTCSNTGEAINLLQQLPHSWSYNFSLADKAGNTAIAEVSPFEMRINKGGGTLPCTNHFQDEHMGAQNRADRTNSGERLRQLENKNVDRSTAEEIFNWFSSPDSPMFYHDYGELFGTLHTFAYLFGENKIWTALPYGTTLEVEWDSWLSGEDMKETYLEGKLLLKNK
ncbi:C45 family autoproteolytic acyltransferase/hydolase [Lentibacillus sediminis]|uniref:C45 family autoproteolytic acyltransferase/hydolase n=1 Tax=Lentibacillus sediminis TaxID=1940529 RepID=UPI000C1BEEA7|nr:C45 family peptidase [Lentibacillus sediminis]